jgi:hypothetical protein
MIYCHKPTRIAANKLGLLQTDRRIDRHSYCGKPTVQLVTNLNWFATRLFIVAEQFVFSACDNVKSFCDKNFISALNCLQK